VNIHGTPGAVRADVLAFRADGESVGFVPTMGALHEGHMRLVERALDENDRVVVSIYVNRLQFDRDEDAEVYPRSLEDDAALLEEAGVDLLFHPDEDVMYPEGDATGVHVDLPLTRRFEGDIRPRFFDGVARVVTKLLHAVPSNRVYFGEKDLQQLMMIRRMVSDLHFEHDVRTVPVARDEDGVAYSSRNRKFTDEDWQVARRVYRVLEMFRDDVEAHTREDLETYRARLERAGLQVQYLDVVDYTTFAPVAPDQSRAVLIVAGFCGDVRLKDHLVLHAANLPALEARRSGDAEEVIPAGG